MKILINFMTIMLFSINMSCQNNQKDSQPMKPSTIDYQEDFIVAKDKPQTAYYVQINNQNVHYQMLVNDFNSNTFYEPFPAYATRVPINFDFIKSGEQHLSFIIKPFEGDTLSRNADFRIQLIKYNDMRKEDGGGSEMIMEWQMPQVKAEQKLPEYRFDTIFQATVPFEIHTIDHAVDLTEMDKDELLKEVVKVYKYLHHLIATDFDAFNVLRRERGQYSASIPIYESKADQLKVLENNKNTFVNKYKDQLQPIANYKLVLYGHGKIVNLERQDGGDNIIWSKNPETNREAASLPLRIYKDKRDGQWHIW